MPIDNNSFTEKIKLIFEADKDSLNDVEKQVEELSGLGKSKDLSKKMEMFKSLNDEYRKRKNELKELEGISTKWAEEIRKANEDWIKNFEASDLFKKEENEEAIDELKTISTDFVDSLTQIFKLAGNELKEILTSAWEELENTLDYSLLSNRRTRELALGYGFSSSQAYGYDKAMSALGFSSEEDLMYANEQQITLFREAFEKYTNKYEKLYDSGLFDKMLEYQVEMNEFQEDLKLEFVEWFSDNKEVIKEGMNAIMTLTKTALSILSWLTHDTGRASGSISDTIASYSNNRSTNISMTNTFNGVDGSQKAQLTQFGTYTIEQLVNAINQ